MNKCIWCTVIPVLVSGVFGYLAGVVAELFGFDKGAVSALSGFVGYMGAQSFQFLCLLLGSRYNKMKTLGGINAVSK